METASLSVVKRSGATEPFSREKIAGGVRKACQGRPVSEDDLALLAQKVEETLRGAGSAEIDAYEIGLAILGPLRELDEVAYLRFASVYQAFDSLEDFEAAITVLRAERDSEPDDAGDRADDETHVDRRGRPHDLSGAVGRRLQVSAARRRFVGCFLLISSSSMSPAPRPSSPDGTRAVVSVVRPDLTDDEYVGHLWSVDLEGDDAPRPLTRGHRDTSPERQPGRPVGRVPAGRAGGQAAGARRRDDRR